jgi:hypothetical protein
MDEFGNKLPVLTLLRIVEQVRDRLQGAPPPQALDGIKEHFAKQFPNALFPSFLGMTPSFSKSGSSLTMRASNNRRHASATKSVLASVVT